MEINKIHNIDCLEGLNQLEDNSVDSVVIDPPYNMGKDFENDDKSWADYVDWCNKWLLQLKRVLKPAGNLIIFGTFESLSRTYVKLLLDFNYKECIVWHKRNGGYTNKYELILRVIKPSKDLLCDFGNYLKSRRKDLNISLKEIGGLCQEKWYHRGGNMYFETGLNYPNMVQYVRLKKILSLNDDFDSFIFKLNKGFITLSELNGQGNVFDYLVGDGIVGGVQLKNKVHSTQKPLKLLRRIIKKLSDNEDIILDCFMGSGTTALACKQLGRNFIGMELSKEYIKIANKRLEQNILEGY